MTETWVENVNYDLIPSANDGWDIRVLTGDLVETVLRINYVSFKEEDLTVKIDYEVVFTPDTSLNPSDEIIRSAVHGIFHSMMVNMVEHADKP
jgi:hypothetical protein